MKFIMRFLFCFLLSFYAHASSKFAAIVVDGETGRVLYGASENEKRYPASLTKQMTLYLMFEALRNKRITMNTRFSVSRRAAMQGPSKLGLRPGQTISVEDIIKSLAIKSANDASIVAAEGLGGTVENFARIMTAKARSIGMTSTVFKNPSGLSDLHVNDKGQYTTAKDMSILGIALYRDFPEYMYIFKLRGFTYGGRFIRTHNNMLGNTPGLDGIKTGYIIASGFNISTSSLRYNKANKPYRLFAVVMGGHSARSRDKKAAELLEYGFQKVGLQTAVPQYSVPQIQPLQPQYVAKSAPTYGYEDELDTLLATPEDLKSSVREKKNVIRNIKFKGNKKAYKISKIRYQR